MVFRHRVCQLAFCCCIKKTDKLNFWFTSHYMLFVGLL
jgi:hypothetical protein